MLGAAIIRATTKILLLAALGVKETDNPETSTNESESVDQVAVFVACAHWIPIFVG